MLKLGYEIILTMAKGIKNLTGELFWQGRVRRLGLFLHGFPCNSTCGDGGGGGRLAGGLGS